MQCQGPIPHGVQNRCIFGYEGSSRFIFGVYVEGSCGYWFVLLAGFCFVHCGDTAVQVICACSLSIRANDLMPASPYIESLARVVGGHVHMVCTAVSP